MKRELSILVLGALLGVLIATAGFAVFSGQSRGQSQVKTIRLAHSLPEASPGHRALVWMAEDLKKRSGGTLELIIFPSGQLGSETDTLEQMQRGALEMTRNNAASIEGFIPDFAVYGTPYLFDDDAHYWAVLQGGVGEALLELGADYNLRGLGYYDSGARSFYTKNKPVKVPQDLKGMKIRTQRSKTAMDLVDTLGASATPMPFGELYTGLQQGIVDGAENNPPSYFDTRHYEVAPYYTLDEHTRVPDVILYSEPLWQQLSPQQKQWIAASVQASTEVQRQYWKEYEEAVLKELESKGVTIIRPDKMPFQKAVQPMVDNLDNPRIQELVKQIRKAANQEGEPS